MTQKHAKRIDLIYVEGSGDIVEALSKWVNEEDVISETSRTFSGQVFDFCKKNNLNTLAISAFNQTKQVAYDGFAAHSKPKKMLSGGLGYHFSQVLYGLRLLALGIRHRPKYFHVTNGATHWLMLAPLKLFGIKIFAQFHNTFWPKGYPPKSLLHRSLIKADAWFLTHIANGAICCSPEIKHQIEEITHNQNCPTWVFKAQFNQHHFQDVLPPPNHAKKPFVVVFAGRIERNKGVFDILDMADKLRQDNVLFHICGGGPALDDLQEACKNRSLESCVKIHGRLNRPALLDIYMQGHAVIVPTRSDFCEGLPMVAIESVLLGRPVVTSSLSNALAVLSGAIVEAQPENIESYLQAIRKLVNDSQFYEAARAACKPLRTQFLDGKQGLAAVLDETL